jgi:hypothetical protein
MKKIIRNPLIPFENKWVALTTDRKKVVASGRTIKELDKNLIKQKIKDVVLTKVLPFDQALSP